MYNVCLLNRSIFKLIDNKSVKLLKFDAFIDMFIFTGYKKQFTMLNFIFE